ncbi:hypothetical protein Hypma_001361 [Hypsizygus marmoreus]|uniref:Uncharacterized protein n=1 Tax=Hypsizygus marmoreus TaxID=39966 RepID=A0A369KAV9_HYPMA|nr:hypothetical protein Hypma_001361 [Hypsizygus marmoreus]
MDHHTTGESETPIEFDVTSFPLASKQRRILEWVLKMIADPKYRGWFLPPVKSFYKVFYFRKTVDAQECAGDTYLYGLIYDVLHVQRRYHSTQFVKNLLACNVVLEALMFQAFKLDMPPKKASDLFELLVGIAFEERTREEMIAWAVDTFGPLVDAVYDILDDDSRSSCPHEGDSVCSSHRGSRKRTRPNSSHELDRRQTKRLKLTLSSRPRAYFFDSSLLVLVAPVRSYSEPKPSEKDRMGVSAAPYEDPGDRVYLHATSVDSMPYLVAGLHIIQCIRLQSESSHSPALFSQRLLRIIGSLRCLASSRSLLPTPSTQLAMSPVTSQLHSPSSWLRPTVARYLRRDRS